MTTRAVIYTRISLDKTGELLAVERQREDCLKIIESRGWDLVGEYSDNSISASKKDVKRPRYDALVAGYEAGEFDAVVCYDLDRLTRQPRQLEDWIDAATERGLSLVTANGEADLSTDGGQMYARIKAAVARGEVDRKGARQRRAARQRVDHGGMSSFKPCLGYTAANQIVEEEAVVVRELFSKFAAGETIYGLRAWLKTSQVRTMRARVAAAGRRKRGEPEPEVEEVSPDFIWGFPTIRHLLTNPRYAARVVYQGEVTGPGTWTPIIADAVFDSVQAILSDPRRTTNRVGTERRHLLSGLATCDVCNANIRGRNAAYFCPNQHLTKARAASDKTIVDLVEAYLKTVGPLSPLTAASPENGGGVLVDLRAQLARIERDYDDDLIDGRRYKTATDKVKARIVEAEKRFAVKTGDAALNAILRATDPVAAFRDATLSTRRAVIGAMLDIRMLKRTEYGAGKFDPETIEYDWKIDRPGA